MNLILPRLQSLLGLFVFILIAWAIGRWRNGRKPIPWRAVGWGVALQFAFAVLVLRAPMLLKGVSDAIDALLGYTRAGAQLVFGDLANGAGATVTNDGGVVIGHAANIGYFAFFVVPTIIFFSALTAVAYHSGVMQYIVQGLAWLMSRTMGSSGAETLAAAANIFVGQTEAPLMVKPFVATATRSELMCIMVGGFANIASGVLGLYTAWLADFIPQVGGHLAAACLISAPASIFVAKLMVPETETPETVDGVQFKVEHVDANLVDAAARGTSEGLGLALNVAAMLIAFTALVALMNGLIGWVGAKLGHNGLTLQQLLGYPMAPLAWLAGVRWSEATTVGQLLGVKTVLNELIAYSQMKDGFTSDRSYLSPRDAIIATYALCGFANFASIGIQVGGIGAMAPSRRHDLSRLGLLAMVGGALASLMTAAVVGVLI
jgi:CNT family concentrative nucleoside transporter